MSPSTRPDRVKAVSNRILLTVSGRALREYSVVRHTGRTSGQEYRNPVSAYPLDDGFVIPVLYGTGSQWVRNILATGHCVVRTKGVDHQLGRPEMLTAEEALPVFPAWQRWMLRRRGIQDFLWVRAIHQPA
jgi:deazaflavin-dependent oxidoreductase (nitroreductase family)